MSTSTPPEDEQCRIVSCNSPAVLTTCKVVASLVQSRTSKRWFAEVLDDAQPLPAPFEKIEHAFDRYADAVTWFGDPEVIHTLEGELARRTILSRHT